MEDFESERKQLERRVNVQFVAIVVAGLPFLVLAARIDTNQQVESHLARAIVPFAIMIPLAINLAWGKSRLTKLKKRFNIP